MAACTCERRGLLQGRRSRMSIEIVEMTIKCRVPQDEAEDYIIKLRRGDERLPVPAGLMCQDAFRLLRNDRSQYHGHPGRLSLSGPAIVERACARGRGMGGGAGRPQGMLGGRGREKLEDAPAGRGLPADLLACLTEQGRLCCNRSAQPPGQGRPTSSPLLIMSQMILCICNTVAFVLELCVLLLAHRMRQSARKTFCANANWLVDFFTVPSNNSVV